MLLTHLSYKSYRELKEKCWLQDIGSQNYKDLVDNLKTLYGQPRSLELDRLVCLQMEMLPDKTLDKYICRFNAKFCRFNFLDLTVEKFRMFLVLLHMKQSKLAPLRTRILAKLQKKT